MTERLADDGGREQRLHFLFRQRLRQRAADLRHRDLSSRIFGQQSFAQQVAIEAAEARKLTRGRARLRTGLHAPSDVIEDVGAARARELDVARRQTLIERDQVGAIRSERVFGQPALHPDRIEKAIDQRFRIAGEGRDPLEADCCAENCAPFR